MTNPAKPETKTSTHTATNTHKNMYHDRGTPIIGAPTRLDPANHAHIKTEANQIKSFLGWYISEARRERGLSRDQLAALSGLTSKTIRKIEHGRGAMNYHLIARLSLVLNMPLSHHLWMGE